MDDGLQMELFGGEQREAVGQIETHLIAENRVCAGAGSVGFDSAVVKDMSEQLLVLFHECEVGKRG